MLITQATSAEFYEFFRSVVNGPWKGIHHSLLDPERLGKQTERLLAVVDDRAVGVAVLAIDGVGGPTLDAVYVLPEWRGKGLGKALTESAVRRFQELGIAQVLCVVSSPGMRKTIGQLPDELRATIRAVYQDDCELDLPEYWIDDADDLV